jgi:hypothetical protein
LSLTKGALIKFLFDLLLLFAAAAPARPASADVAPDNLRAGRSFQLTIADGSYLNAFCKLLPERFARKKYRELPAQVDDLSGWA